MKNPAVLVVDDSKAIVSMMKALLEGEGYIVTTCLSADEALSAIERQKPDAVIMDVRFPGLNGLEALAQVKKKDQKLPVIIMTAYGTTQVAIEAMKAGAYDYVTKPFKSEEVKALVKKALQANRLMKESVSYPLKSPVTQEGACIIGNTAQMLEVYKTIGKVADSNATVLITGESGTGKELVARAIYQNSSRKDKPFLAVNCAAIPESLLESELFGHEKGAFTGAINKRIGKFQQCDAGTIFLDEIGDMALSTQTKILRVLQEHAFQPVGSEKTITVDVRVIASTNKDLAGAIEKNEFREDLYYRLNVVTISLPCLRQRKEDIPPLVEYFIKKFNKEFNKNIKRAAPEVLARMQEHSWPGNVRELENAIQTAVLMGKEEILLLDDFPLFTAQRGVQAEPEEIKKLPNNYEDAFRNILPTLKDSITSASGKLYQEILGRTEKALIEFVLKETEQNQTEAARILGISRNTLRTRMQEFGFQKDLSNRS